METKHVLNHQNHLNLRNSTSFHSYRFKDNKIQPKIKVRNQRNKEVPEEEGQRMSGSLTRNNLNRKRKFLIFPQVDKSTYLIQRKAMSMGKSRVQATDCVDLQQVLLIGYKQFPQEMQAYPVSREPVTVQPTNHDNNSALLDLPNV